MTHVYVKYAEVDVKQLHEKSSPVDSLVNNGAEKKRGTVRFK
ncbi:hypothetical protein [Geomicrobium sp. JCM 19037]|nr:hypothetical protein [Geomicrobium sp. JCM 19037]